MAAPVSAEALYRCAGASGETVFTGHVDGFKDCKRIGGTGPARPAKKPVAMAAAPVASLAGVTASVETPIVASFTGVTASVEAPAATPVLATAKIDTPEAAPAAPVRKGQWDYKESAAGAAPLPDVADASLSAKGSRVLRGAVYRVDRADGGVEYTNVKPGGVKGHAVTMLFTYIATCAACDLHSPINWNSVALNLTAYGDAIHSASGEFGVDEALLRAIIHAESAFNPRALSIKGAQGLMQLIPGTARDMGVMDAFDASQNIRGGARYLALLLKSFNGNEKLAAAAYNAGPGAVQKYNGVPPYDETRVYVERVGQLRKRYGDSIKASQPTTGNVPLADRGA
ncbi:lytic transglycosylase domain-containing protein [Luteibacter rhizovicinus]|uniref:lytic transglycosylase domain-containing protein n=1 Tax=Luteibacter rhizovicinus TaxID=242606 RepID=UPI001FB4FEF2|nr:lytic transglycosylase domain-containing protein [Luteibacter rhizovicinus]